MPRTIPRTKFQDGFAAGWAFGVSPAFKAALDIAPTPRVLSARGSLMSELSREGVRVSREALHGDEKALAELRTAMRSAGLVVLDSFDKMIQGKKRVVITLETEGDPPVYKFSVGDIFYDPPQLHKMDWADALKGLRRCIQIARVDADQITAKLWTCKDGMMSLAPDFTCSAVAFARLLRTGAMDIAEAAAP